MREGSARLAFYALMYFLLYALYGLGVKYAQSPAIDGFPGLSELEFLVYSTLGSATICLGVILAARWWHFPTHGRELVLMALSGFCTALVLPTTTLMYSLPISVMVAMVLMRGSLIVVARLVDTVLLWQGLSRKPVRREENAAVVVSLLAVALQLGRARAGDFDFLGSRPAVLILGVYITAYSLRLYLMNAFKFTRVTAAGASAKNFFAVEQLSAAVWIFGFTGLVVMAPGLFRESHAAMEFSAVVQSPPPTWAWAALVGLPFGLSAFFSAFLFLFAGRTSTFSGLVNRLSSLLAGTAATLLFAYFFGGSWPKGLDWLSLVLILGAVALLWRAETRQN